MAPQKDLTIHRITNSTQRKVQYQFWIVFKTIQVFQISYMPVHLQLHFNTCSIVPCPARVGMNMTKCRFSGFPSLKHKHNSSDFFEKGNNLTWQDLLMSKGSKVLKPTFMRAPPNPALNMARIPSLSPSSLAAFEYKCLPTNPFLWVVVNNVYSVTPSTNKRK